MVTQVTTRRATLNSVMKSRPFKSGFADAVKGVNRPDLFAAMNDQWAYEKGWAFYRFLQRMGRGHFTKIAHTNPQRVRADFVNAYKLAIREGTAVDPSDPTATCFCFLGGIRKVLNAGKFDNLGGLESADNTLGRVWLHAMNVSRERYHTDYPVDANDIYIRSFESFRDFLTDIKKRVDADPFFRRSQARKNGTEKHVARARRLAKRSQPAQAAA